jgi:hypothetical protein
MGAAIHDESGWPLYRVRLSRTAMTHDDFRAYVGGMQAPFTRGERFAVMIDTSDSPVPTALQRQEIARGMRVSTEQYPGLLIALALVASSLPHRGVFTAITWLVGQRYPARAFATSAPAELWLREQLGVSGR